MDVRSGPSGRLAHRPRGGSTNARCAAAAGSVDALSPRPSILLPPGRGEVGRGADRGRATPRKPRKFFSRGTRSRRTNELFGINELIERCGQIANNDWTSKTSYPQEIHDEPFYSVAVARKTSRIRIGSGGLRVAWSGIAKPSGDAVRNCETFGWRGSGSRGLRAAWSGRGVRSALRSARKDPASEHLTPLPLFSGTSTPAPLVRDPHPDPPPAHLHSSPLTGGRSGGGSRRQGGGAWMAPAAPRTRKGPARPPSKEAATGPFCVRQIHPRQCT